MTRYAEALVRDDAWTPELVKIRLEEACETLRRLPMPSNARPGGHRSWWPPVLYDFWETWNGLSEIERTERERDLNRSRRFGPTPSQIQAMDDCLNWLWLVDPPRNRKVLVARCSGYSLRRIARIDGRSHEGLRQAIDRSLSQIARALDSGKA